jgi:hypothetical protein
MEALYFKSSDGWIRRVPASFSWGAFFFGATWAFANRAWLLGLLCTAAELPVELLSHVGRVRGHWLAAVAFLASVSVMYVLGRYGHVWLAWSLRRQGYEELQGHAI